MKARTTIFISTTVLAIGVAIGALIRKDQTVTRLVGVPVRIADTRVAIAAPSAVAPLPTAADGATPPPADPTVTDREYNLSHQAASDAALSEKTPANSTSTVAPQPAAPSAPVLKYTAAKGDTVTDLAGALLGGNTQANRDAIINANPSLKANPDRLLAGKSYRIVAPEGGLTAAPQAAEAAAPRPTTQPDADQLIQDDQSRSLRYTAKAGDTVGSLALALLGSDSKANRSVIVNANASLKANPDLVIAGKTYWIPAPVASAGD